MSTEKPNDGGPAFPSPEHRAFDSPRLLAPTAGMSLRDWFAGQALIGLSAVYDSEVTRAESEAARAYELADAMLIYRERSR